MKWAMIDANNIVENVIIWDGIGDLFVGKTVVQLQEGEWCSIGAIYDPNANGSRFTPGPTEEQPEG